MNQLEPGQTVLLRLSDHSSLAARVEAVGAEETVLILLTPPLHAPGNGQAAAVEVTTRRGILALDVRVVGHHGRGSVRVALDREATQADTVQRRDFVRVDAVVPVVVRDGGPDGPAHEVFSRNVSGGGLLLSGVSHLQAGDSAWVAIDLQDGTPPLKAPVTVVRDGPRDGRAVRIASISAGDEQRIVRFAFARERREWIVRDD